MSALGSAATMETIVAYRFWRVMPFERLDGSSTYRLCAMGTYGVPKVWEPRRANVALCSAYETTHEAPWPRAQGGDERCQLSSEAPVSAARE